VFAWQEEQKTIGWRCMIRIARTKRETWRRLGARGRAPGLPFPRHPVRWRTGPGAVRAQPRPAVGTTIERPAGPPYVPKWGEQGLAFRRRAGQLRCATVSAAGHCHVPVSG